MTKQLRVVVTGMGTINPLGNDVNESWSNLINGKSGLTHLDLDSNVVKSKVAGLVNFPHDYPMDKVTRKSAKFIKYGLFAADQALKEAKLPQKLSDYRTDVIISSGFGGLDKTEENYYKIHNNGKVNPFFLPNTLINELAATIAIKHGCYGNNMGISSSCAGGLQSIGMGFQALKNNQCDIAIVGGSESVICELGLAGFEALGALNTSYNGVNPQKMSRPWDKQRNGFVMGEGAAILVLETLEQAQQRGVRIYGEIIGYSSHCDAHHVVAPCPQGTGILKAMTGATQWAQITPSELDYIHAHATSTIEGDLIEAQTIAKFMENNNDNYAVSSTKGATGHLLGASGALGVLFCLHAINDKKAPPNLNLDEIDGKLLDQDHDLMINLVPNKAIDYNINIAMCNALGFGGVASSIIIKSNSC